MKQITFLVAVIFLSLIFPSCKKDDNDSSNNTSKVIRYEVSGNFTGSLFASYTTANGGTANDPISSLPWNKEITYNNSVTAAIVAISGNGGVAGQQVTIVVKRGGSQLSSTKATAGSSGSFTQSAPVVIF